MAAHWDSRAHLFEGAASHNRNRDAWRAVLASALGQGPGQALDLGCGTGACAVLLAELGFTVTGVDASAAMLAEARQAAARAGVQVEYRHAGMDQADLPQGSADVVTLRNVLWTLENPAAALALAFRLLKPGGRVLVSDGLWRHGPDARLAPMSEHLPHACGLTEDQARAGLRAAGFTGVKAWQDGFTEHPYGAMYDDPATLIRFFVLTAERPG